VISLDLTFTGAGIRGSDDIRYEPSVHEPYTMSSSALSPRPLSPLDASSPGQTSIEEASRANNEKSGVLSEAQLQNDTENEARFERKLKGLSWFLVILAILSPTFLYALDNTVMANVRPSIIDTFGHIDMLTWLSVSYPMGEVGGNPLWLVHSGFHISLPSDLSLGGSSMINSTIRSCILQLC
jgi:hypothetical protein